MFVQQRGKQSIDDWGTLRAILYLAVVLLAALFMAGPVESSDALGNVALGLIAGAGLGLVDQLQQNRRYLPVALRAAWYARTRVRISASYLYRIELDGRFLLIRGGRFPDQFQPVGGVFKILTTGSARLQQLGVVTDTFIPIDANSNNDLRIRLAGGKILPFLHWFESGQGRETSPWREFQEELIAANLVAADKFPNVFHEKRWTVMTFRWSDYAQAPELLIAEVHELLPNGAQLQALRLAAAEHADVLQLFTADEILTRGNAMTAQPRHAVSMTSKWLLGPD